MQRLCIPPSSRDSVRITMRTSLRSLELNLEFDSCKDTSLRGREALIEDFSDEAHIIYNRITSGIGILFSTTKVSNLRHIPLCVGISELADTFLLMNMVFDSDEARLLKKQICEKVLNIVYR